MLFTCFDSKKQRKTDLFRIHHHAELELGFICSGEGEYLLAENKYNAVKNDLFLVRPNEQHCIPTINTDELVSFNIHFSPYYLWNICSEYIPLGIIKTLVCQVPVTHHFSGFEDKMLNIKRLCENADKNRYAIKISVLELMCALAVEIEKSTENSLNGSFTEFRHIDDIQNTISFINSHQTEKITLKDIAKSSRMSVSHLSSVFKSYTGVTPYEYLLLQRVDKAAVMLRRTDKSVLELSEECGFGSLANFNKIFKNITSMTPGQYRTVKNKEKI